MKRNIIWICCPWLSSVENFQNSSFCSKTLHKKGTCPTISASCQPVTRNLVAGRTWLGLQFANGVRQAGEFLSLSLGLHHEVTNASTCLHLPVGWGCVLVHLASFQLPWEHAPDPDAVPHVPLGQGQPPAAARCGSPAPIMSQRGWGGDTATPLPG